MASSQEYAAVLLVLSPELSCRTPTMSSRRLLYSFIRRFRVDNCEEHPTPPLIRNGDTHNSRKRRRNVSLFCWFLRRICFALPLLLLILLLLLLSFDLSINVECITDSRKQYKARSEGSCGTGSKVNVKLLRPKRGIPVSIICIDFVRRNITKLKIRNMSNPYLLLASQWLAIAKSKYPSSLLAANGSKPRKHNSPRKSCIPSHNGVPESIHRRSLLNCSHCLEIDVVQDRISCISSKIILPQIVVVRIFETDDALARLLLPPFLAVPLFLSSKAWYVVRTISALGLRTTTPTSSFSPSSFCWFFFFSL